MPLQIEDYATMTRRPEPWAKLKIQHEPTGEVQPAGFATQRQYRLEARATVMYWANDAERPHARRAAQRHLTEFLYKDFQEIASKLRHAAWSGTREEVYQLANEISRLVEAKADGS